MQNEEQVDSSDRQCKTDNICYSLKVYLKASDVEGGAKEGGSEM
jgi:hypothetical protein